MSCCKHAIILSAVLAIHPQAIHAETSQAASVVFLDDADAPAQIWAEDNPDSIAVSIRLGPETTVPVATIEHWLKRDFAEHGVTRVRFFYERGPAGSSVFYHSRNHAWGPFALADSRAQIAETSAQFLFEVRRGLN